MATLSARLRAARGLVVAQVWLPERVVRALLARGGPACVVVSVNALPATVPTNFVYFGGSIVCATDDDRMTRAAADSAVVALSAQGIGSSGRWQWHVQAVGRTATIDDADTRAELAMLGLLPPGSQRPVDYVRMMPEVLTGRQFGAVPSPGAAYELDVEPEAGA